MKLRICTVLVILLIGALLTAQPTLAQVDDPSRNRGPGIGLLSPIPALDVKTLQPILSLRLWILDSWGLEGLFTMINLDAFSISTSAVGGGGGLLFKIINSPFVDLYAAGRGLIIWFTLPISSYSPDYSGQASRIMVWLASAGAEVSPASFFALSFEITFFAKIDIPIASIIGSPGGLDISFSGFVFVLWGGIHLYF